MGFDSSVTEDRIFDVLLSAEAHMLIERFLEPSWLSLFFGFVDGRLPRL